MNDDDEEEYKVGYKRPPKSGQIKPGETRNPNGRRGKKAKPTVRSSDAEILARIDNEVIDYRGEKITRREVELRALQVKSMGGDAKAHQTLEALRKKVKMEEPKEGGGALLIPIMESPLHWEQHAAWQQAQYRSDRVMWEELYPGLKPDGKGGLVPKTDEDEDKDRE